MTSDHVHGDEPVHHEVHESSGLAGYAGHQVRLHFGDHDCCAVLRGPVPSPTPRRLGGLAPEPAKSKQRGVITQPVFGVV